MNDRHQRSGRGRRKGLSPFKKEWRGERIGLLGTLRELVLGILSGVLPWWFGANDPPAVFAISALIVVLGLLTMVEAVVKDRQRGLGWTNVLLAPPIAGLALIVIYGLIQWVEISPDLLRTLSPKRFELWEFVGGGDVLIPPGSESSEIRLPTRIGWLDGETLESVAWLGSLWVLAVCVIRLPGRWGPFRRHSLVMIVSCALMGFQSMLQAMTFNGKVLWMRQAGIVITSAGPFFVHSHLAAYLNIGLGFALAHLVFMNWQERSVDSQEHLFVDQRTGLGRGFIWMYAGGIILVSVLASRSRGGLLAMFMGMAVLGLIWFTAARRFRRVAAGPGSWSWIFGFLGVIIFALTMLTDVFAIFSRARGIVSGEGGHAAGVRRRVWALAWETWKEAPIWGTGWGSYLWAAQTRFNAAVGYSTHAESDYVQVLPEGGLIGVILVGATLVFLFLASKRLVGRLQQPSQFVLVGGALFALTAVAWGSLTENNLRTPGLVIPALITAAHVVRLSIGWSWFEEKMSEDEAVQTRLDLPGRVIGACLGLVLVGVASLSIVQGQMVNRVWGILRPVGLNIAGTELLGWYGGETKDEKLEDQRVALMLVEPVAPHWGDYHIRQAVSEVETYERRTRALLIREGIPENEAGPLSQVVFMAVQIHNLPASERAETVKDLLLEQEVRDHLGQAAKSLAMAWRQQPTSAMVQTELALLSWIFKQGPDPEESLRRAIRLVGERREILLRIGLIALALQYEDTAEEALASYIAIPESSMQVLLEIPQLRSDMALVSQLAGRSAYVAVRSAEVLIPEGDQDNRRQAGERILEKLRQESGLSQAESTELRARALWLTGNSDEALSQIKLAMALNAESFDLRDRQIRWLLSLGRTREAFEQAQVIGYLWPKDPRARQLLEMTAEADAEGRGTVSEKENQP
jgi:hypothetical protein